MKTTFVSRKLLALLLALTIAFTLQSSPANATENTGDIKDGVIVYYFHGNQRCYTCMNIEKLTISSTEGRFSEGLKDGSVKFISVNVDEDANAHFIEDYQLLVRSVVIAEVKDGREVDFRRLDKVWQLHSDPEAFIDYFNTETTALLEGQ